MQLLTELDGAEQRRGVFVIGATNRFDFVHCLLLVIYLPITLYCKANYSFCRPEVMDPAVLRPCRFGKRLYVPLPSAEQREWILKALARKRPVDTSVDLRQLAGSEACEKLSGADLAALVCLCFMFFVGCFIPLS